MPTLYGRPIGRLDGMLKYYNHGYFVDVKGSGVGSHL